ncbi:sulfatase-like hydrolase/transferase [Verrucomicrobiales bacterium]|jgi:arylsulfatase A-like enzyme|nr:sulfatase-like hydrolase/transferase [Verrucomicrobiales bacterium]
MTKKLYYLLLAAVLISPMIRAAELPNILWISSEDNGPQLGCYGDEYAVTPHLDALAARGLRYTRASSNAPVCAPARTTVISGIFPPSTGAEHMRSETALPDSMKMFPVYLRELGYYCTNSSKEDYNLVKTGQVWDESNKKAHWKKRKKGQPFFAVFNETISHESKIRNEMADELRLHDPAKARIPAYHPDTPEVRRDWAQYYDRLTQMDASLGARLQEIEDAGLADNTVVIYWGDHGSGMPRSKRWPYNSGLHVPFIAHFPAKWKHLAPDEYETGGTSDRMIGFIDLAPTMLSLVGVEPKPWMHGHAFAGQFETASPEYSYGFRGRMDERVDLVRTVLGQRYVYIRQYMPHRIYGQYIDYMFQTPTTRVWHDMFHAGELNEAQSHFWKEKPAEELYDLETDPDEVNNLAESADHEDVLAKMRKAHQEWEKEIRDVGFLPEAEVHARSEGSTPYEMGQNPAQYDFDAVFAAAQLASSKKAEDIPAIIELLKSKDDAVRYWGATGLLIHKEAGLKAGHDVLHAALGDECASVAIVAAESLGRFGDEADQKKAVATLLSNANQATGNVFEAILAMNAIDYLDESAASESEAILALPAKPGKEAPRVGGYVGNVLKKLRADFGK